MPSRVLCGGNLSRIRAPHKLAGWADGEHRKSSWGTMEGFALRQPKSRRRVVNVMQLLQFPGFEESDGRLLFYPLSPSKPIPGRVAGLRL